VASRNPKQLIVEGPDDLFSVVGLMRAHIAWPQKKEEALVWIESGDGVKKILERDYLKVKLKTPGLEILGVMLDADTNSQGLYESVRNLCVEMFPQMPEGLPADGLVTENARQRFGVWIMPDNISAGSLETFLRSTVPGASAPLWTHATESVSKARSMGATCRECHLDKAHLYTWLAWQDPPGQSGGMALTRKILDPHSASSLPFVKWFRDLYRL
jgi:hypothetical protein